MKSWSEADGAGAAGREEFVPFGVDDDAFVPFAADPRGVAEARSGEAAGNRNASPREAVEAAAAEVMAAQIEAAYERGLAEARAERSEAESSEAGRAFGVLDAAAADIRGRISREASQWSRAAVELAVLVAERIVRAQLPVDRDALQARVAAAVESVSAENGAYLFVAASDLAWVESHLESELAALREVRALEIEADPALEAGEFRLEHRGAVVDGRIEAMLARFREELADFPVATGGED